MKKLIIFGALIAVVAVSCKKRHEENVSQVVTPSTPTVTLTGEQFYSIPVGGTIPSISATAYDSTLMEVDPTTYDASVIDNTKPGLYVVPIVARNKNGYKGSTVVYVAVTNIPSTVDLSGNYLRSTGAPVVITKVANGLYSTNDVGGAPTLQVEAFFAQLDETKLDFPVQPTSVGDLSCTNATVSNVNGDTVLSWIVVNGNFGTSLRTFKKQ